uniref:DUF834 domain-containing protein n=1 Tax=Oryza punctata TaxID=4537 RepID=A0A0E0L663_ORYPU
MAPEFHQDMPVRSGPGPTKEAKATSQTGIGGGEEEGREGGVNQVMVAVVPVVVVGEGDDGRWSLDGWKEPGESDE